MPMNVVEQSNLAPGEGLEPSSPEGHQLARRQYDLEADPY